MVSLGKNPCISIADGCKIEGKIKLLPWRRGLHFERKALGKPGAIRAQPPYLAARPIGADQKARPIALAGGLADAPDRRAHNLPHTLNPFEAGAGRDRLAQAEFVELSPHRHHADRFAALQHNGRGGVRAVALQPDAAHHLSHHRLNRISERLDGLDGQSAGTGFCPREVLLVEQQYGLASGGKIIGGRAAGRVPLPLQSRPKADRRHPQHFPGQVGFVSHSSECFSRAIRTSWLRVRTPVFSKSCCSTALTELSEIASRAPISLLVSPSNTPLSTACSRCVKPLRPARRGGIASGRGNDGTGHRGVEPDLSGKDLPDGLHQAARGTVFEKDPGGTVFQSAQHHRIAHAGGHHQNTAGETGYCAPGRETAFPARGRDRNPAERRRSPSRCGRASASLAEAQVATIWKSDSV